MMPRMRYSDWGSSWASEKYNKVVSPRKHKFIWVFAKTLKRGILGESFSFGDTGFVFISWRVKNQKHVERVILHELIHIKLGHGSHDKDFRKWAKKLGAAR